jgi:hypothetical protein
MFHVLRFRFIIMHEYILCFSYFIPYTVPTCHSALTPPPTVLIHPSLHPPALFSAGISKRTFTSLRVFMQPLLNSWQTHKVLPTWPIIYSYMRRATWDTWNSVANFPITKYVELIFRQRFRTLKFSLSITRVYIQKFPDRVDNEIYAYLCYYSLRSNTKGYGGKTH